MNKTNLTLKSTLEEAYLEQEKLSDWSINSKNAYRRNIKDVANHMKRIGLEPTLDNVTYEYCKTWKKDHVGKLKPNTLKQQKSTLSSLFRHLNNANVLQGNPFLNVEIKDYTGNQYLSKDLNILELYQVYKAAHELQLEGVNVLAPTLLDIFTGLRSTNLISLKVRSLDFEAEGIRIEFSKPDPLIDQESKKGEKIPNSKNRECFIPLPPKVLVFFSEYTKGMDPEDSLLHGLRGKAFANKQMNYITNKICEHLGWITDIPETDETKSNQKKKEKTKKFFTPHGLRYSIATIFHEMGVGDNAIRLLLLHSKKTGLGTLERYLRRDTKEVKQIRMAQLLLETLLETALEMEEKFGVMMELEAIYEQLPTAFENQMKNIYYVNLFKEQMIRFTMSKMEQMLTQTVVVPHKQYPNFPMAESNYPAPSPFYNSNHYQGGFQVNPGSAPMTLNPYPQASNGFYQPSIEHEWFTNTKR